MTKSVRCIETFLEKVWSYAHYCTSIPRACTFSNSQFTQYSLHRIESLMNFPHFFKRIGSNGILHKVKKNTHMYSIIHHHSNSFFILILYVHVLLTKKITLKCSSFVGDLFLQDFFERCSGKANI